jgi:hypothetical protein
VRKPRRKKGRDMWIRVFLRQQNLNERGERTKDRRMSILARSLLKKQRKCRRALMRFLQALALDADPTEDDGATTDSKYITAASTWITAAASIHGNTATQNSCKALPEDERLVMRRVRAQEAVEEEAGVVEEVENEDRV